MRQLLDLWASRFPAHPFQRVLFADGRLRYTYASPGLRQLGLDPDALANEGARHQWIHPDDRGRWRASIIASAETLQPTDEELRIIGQDGKLRWVRSLCTPRRLASGAVVWDGLLLDVTARREALDALRAARAGAEADHAARLRDLKDAAESLHEGIAALRLALGQGALAEAEAALDGLEATLDGSFGPPASRRPERAGLVVIASPLARAGLRALLEGMGWQAEETDALPDGRTRNYDLVVVERGLLGADPAASIAALAPARVAVLQPAADQAEARMLAACGAALVLPAGIPAAALRAAVSLALETQGALLLQDEAPVRRDDGLTPRQAEVLALLGRGLSNEAIARELGIAAGTAKLHVAAVLKRLGLRNRTEAALHAREGAWAGTPPPGRRTHQAHADGQ